MIVVEIRIENSTERGFMEHDHMIETLTPNGAILWRSPLCGEDA
jgi:hypothetical protein